PELPAELWDLETQTVIVRFSGSYLQFCCAFAPDGKRIVSGTGQVKEPDFAETEWHPCDLHVWCTESNSELSTLSGHSGPVYSCNYSPDGRRAVSASWDNTVKLWDVTRNQEVCTFSGHSSQVEYCVFTLDGKYVLSASTDYTVKVWEVRSANNVGTFICEARPSAIGIGIGMSLFVGDWIGTFFQLRLMGLKRDTPIITPVRLWRYPRFHWWNRLSFLRRRGRWDKKISANCRWCGQRFPVRDRVLDVITGIVRNANLKPAQSPCVELPNEAWEEPGLLSECPKCHKPLRFNPFIVDNRERYS
ncbi:MAG: WD40 repeat domain-containing protein, partial [bacterium]